MNWNLAAPVHQQSLRTPAHLALAADGVERSYAGLVARARRLAAALQADGIGRGSRVGILGSRSLIAVEAVLGVAWAGAAYVPLGLTWPEARLQAVLAQVRLDAIIADCGGAPLVTPAVRAAARRIFLPDDALPDATDAAEPLAMAPGELAYIIFTSGTTGVPKGVMVPTGSVAAYLAALGARKQMTPEDRASQFTELSFDPSLGEIFLPWHSGASVHVVPPIRAMSPARFIRERGLTIWGSTPAAIAWMRDTRSLQPGAFPKLRYSSFGGEPLPLASVQAWQAAAPNSVIDNLYGPTEATVDCVGQMVAPGATPVVTPRRGVLAIGVAHPGTELAVLGPDQRPVPAGEVGELAISGAQLSNGYLDAAAVTAERFPTIDGKRWYLTGDLAMRDAAGQMHHLGRIDNQIKIHGYRVELEDIEAQMRAIAGHDQVAAVAWPIADGVAQAIVGFIAQGEAKQVREALRGRLPPYMVPTAIHALPALPFTPNGKLDRRALIARLEAER